MSDHRKQQFFCDPNGNQPVEDECTLELLLTSQATSDPPITQELVEHLIADFAEFEEVRLYPPEIQGKPYRALIKFGNSFATSMVKEKLEQYTIEGTQISVIARQFQLPAKKGSFSLDVIAAERRQTGFRDDLYVDKQQDHGAKFDNFNRWYSDDPTYYLNLIGEFTNEQRQKSKLGGINNSAPNPHSIATDNEDDYDLIMNDYKQSHMSEQSSFQKNTPYVQEVQEYDENEGYYEEQDYNYSGEDYVQRGYLPEHQFAWPSNPRGLNPHKSSFYPQKLPPQPQPYFNQPQYYPPPQPQNLGFQNFQPPMGYQLNNMFGPYSSYPPQQMFMPQGQPMQPKPGSQFNGTKRPPFNSHPHDNYEEPVEEYYGQEEEEEIEHKSGSYQDKTLTDSASSSRGVDKNANKTNIDKYKSLVDTRGCNVVIVRGLEHHSLNNESVSSLFSNFGNLTRLYFSRQKHFAVIEYPTKELASIAKEMMNSLFFFGHQLKISFAQPPEFDSHVPQEHATQVFRPHSKYYRFRSKKNISINPPSKVLHISNVAKEIYSEKDLLRVFSEKFAVKKVKLLNAKEELKGMALIEFETLEAACNCIATMHNKLLSSR